MQEPWFRKGTSPGQEHPKQTRGERGNAGMLPFGPGRQQQPGCCSQAVPLRTGSAQSSPEGAGQQATSPSLGKTNIRTILTM